MQCNMPALVNNSQQVEALMPIFKSKLAVIIKLQCLFQAIQNLKRVALLYNMPYSGDGDEAMAVIDDVVVKKKPLAQQHTLFHPYENIATHLGSGRVLPRCPCTCDPW